MRPIIMRCELTSRLGRTRPAHVRSRGSKTLLRIRSSAGYTIDTHESKSRKRHPIVDILSPTWIQDLIQAYGLWVLFTVVMLESMGIAIPGDTALVTAALYPGPTPQIAIAADVLVATTPAMMADNIGYPAASSRVMSYV